MSHITAAPSGSLETRVGVVGDQEEVRVLGEELQTSQRY